MNGWCGHLVDEECLLALGGVLHALLHHVTRELVLGEVQHLPPHTAHWGRGDGVVWWWRGGEVQCSGGVLVRW